MRSGVGILGAILLVSLAPAGARADGPTATTSSSTTTETASTLSYAPAAAAPLVTGCATAGVAAIVVPGQDPLAVGATPSSLGPSAYPASDPVLSFATALAAGEPCDPDAVSVRSLSLFGGAITADEVSSSGGAGSVSNLEVDGSPVTLAPGASIAVDGWGLLVSDARVGSTLSAPLAVRLLAPHGSLPAGAVVLVGFGATPAAPTTTQTTQTTTAAAATTTTPAATTTPTTTAKPQQAAPKPQHAKPKPAPVPARPKQPATAKTTAKATTTKQPAQKKQRHHRRKHRKHRPLKATPPLGLRHAVFPVLGGASYGDTYGAGRSDVSGGWHHGDDLFAPLGTPLVAVASGTLSLVGWNELGGWRLWLEDADGNTYYYAHLAAYSRWILHHRHVRAGQVIGFLGRTGDAFTTPPHLHFEVHPKRFLELGYDGAVDPTGYLRGWRTEHLPHKDVPRPARLVAPKGVPAEEARVVWRQLVAARHLADPPAPRLPAAYGHPVEGTTLVPLPAEPVVSSLPRAARPTLPPPHRESTWGLLVVALLAGTSTLAGLLARRGRR